MAPIIVFKNDETSLLEYFEGLKSKKNRLLAYNSLMLMGRSCFQEFLCLSTRFYLSVPTGSCTSIFCIKVHFSRNSKFLRIFVHMNFQNWKKKTFIIKIFIIKMNSNLKFSCFALHFGMMASVNNGNKMLNTQILKWNWECFLDWMLWFLDGFLEWKLDRIPWTVQAERKCFMILLTLCFRWLVSLHV